MIVSWVCGTCIGSRLAESNKWGNFPLVMLLNAKWNSCQLDKTKSVVNILENHSQKKSCRSIKTMCVWGGGVDGGRGNHLRDGWVSQIIFSLPQLLILYITLISNVKSSSHVLCYLAMWILLPQVHLWSLQQFFLTKILVGETESFNSIITQNSQVCSPSVTVQKSL